MYLIFHLRGKTSAGVVGVFPSNFVELVGAATTGGATAAPGGTAGGAIEINADYRALYDYDAEDETELTIKEGDILHVISETVPNCLYLLAPFPMVLFLIFLS